MQHSDEQTTLALSFVSYLGFYETSYGVQSSERTHRCIQHGIDTSSILKGDWRIVWGPAMYRLPLTIFDENLMFVVQSKSAPSRYVIVVRGTNPVSISNWILQDFSVMQQTVWPYHKRDGGITPKLSKGSARGLQALQSMQPRKGLPGAGTTLYNFFAQEMAANQSEDVEIIVTGHSLGGALAPTVALWLADTQGASDDPNSPPWDPKHKARFAVYSFGGPSPGDADFATYYDSKLGKTTHRIWNQYDVVPHGWINASLAGLPKLYDPHIAPDLLMRLVLWSTTVLAKRGNYRHVVEQALAMAGSKVCPHLTDYPAQMIFQHTAAYPELLGVCSEIDATKHFEYKKHVHGAVHASRVSVLAATGAPASVQAEALSPEQRRAHKISSVSKAVHRLYRVPATVALAVVPEAVALSKLKLRKHIFHAQHGAQQAAQ